MQERLGQLGAGLTVELLHEVLARGEAARATATPLHPPYAGGWLAHLAMVVAIRELLIEQGWRADNAFGSSKVISADEMRAITIHPGEDALGHQPTTKYRKGPTYNRAVGVNAQLWLFPELGPADRAPFLLSDEGGAPTTSTWTLLFTRIEEGERREIHAELSLPCEMTGDYPSDWYERIFLPILPLDPAPNVKDLPGFDEGEGIDVPVQKK